MIGNAKTSYITGNVGRPIISNSHLKYTQHSQNFKSDQVNDVWDFIRAKVKLISTHITGQYGPNWRQPKSLIMGKCKTTEQQKHILIHAAS